MPQDLVLPVTMAGRVHRVKISLLGIDPPIWRRVIVDSDISLAALARVVQQAMGWTGSHLHAFVDSRDGVLVAARGMLAEARDEATIALAELTPIVGSRLRFVYDFGDDWLHEIVVEAIADSGGEPTPTCIAGERACPPEDCGGPPGFLELVAAIRDPLQPLRTGIDQSFDPEAFDLEEINRRVLGLDRVEKKRKAKRSSLKGSKHKWVFASRFRARAFGWRSQPAIKRVREAVSEIKKAAKKDPILGAEGAVRFVEKISPAIENVDSSSGAMGSAVNRALDALVPIIATAPADNATRDRWLEHLWQAFEDDEMPYIEALADHWGEICATEKRASRWADRLLPILRHCWADDRPGGYFSGTPACLSALLAAGRHQELLDLIEAAPFRWWSDRRFGALALAAMGRVDEALEYAESSLGENDNRTAVVEMCEEFLLAAGRTDEAYDRFAIEANLATTNLATFRNIAKKYPTRDKREILADLIRSTPGSEGKWFATARRLGDLELAADLANRTACDPKTLNRAARDHRADDPAFARHVALASLRSLAAGWGYEITSADVLEAYEHAIAAAKPLGEIEQTRKAISEICARDVSPERLVQKSLARWIAPKSGA